MGRKKRSPNPKAEIIHNADMLSRTDLLNAVGGKSGFLHHCLFQKTNRIKNTIAKMKQMVTPHHGTVTVEAEREKIRSVMDATISRVPTTSNFTPRVVGKFGHNTTE